MNWDSMDTWVNRFNYNEFLRQLMVTGGGGALSSTAGRLAKGCLPCMRCNPRFTAARFLSCSGFNGHGKFSSSLGKQLANKGHFRWSFSVWW